MSKLEITRKNYAEWVETARRCTGLVFRGLDLREDDWRLAEFAQAQRPSEGCVFIGCKLGPRMAECVALHFGAVFPELAWRPYQVYRDTLYTPDDLFNAYSPGSEESYAKCMDWKVYLLTRQPAGADELVARRLHDHFISEALREFLEPYKRVVAFMGGHDVLRGTPVYRQVVEMARQLAREGYLVVTGGGPGLMEAANLGAYLAPHPDDALEPSLTVLGPLRHNEPGWLNAAWTVRGKLAHGGVSLGIPTWFYGHEPPNLFASAIAKYFENSFREEGLLAIATSGVIFAEGNGGTVQEIFQDGCQNYYGTYGGRSPMVLFGEEYWNPTPDAEGNYPGKSKPAWPLLRKLAQEKGFLDRVCVTSDPAQVLAKIRAFAVL